MKNATRIKISFGIILIFLTAGLVQAQSLNSFQLQDNRIPQVQDFLTYESIGDTTVQQLHPGDLFGDLDRMTVNNMYGASPIYERDSLIIFDLSEIPSNAIITSATLNLYYYLWVDNNPVGRTIKCHRVTSTWDEDTTTWNNRPTYDSTATSSATVPGTYAWMQWDVTEDVLDMVSGTVTNYGWEMRDDTYWGGFDIPLTLFRTKENSNNHPYLEIEAIIPVKSMLFGRIENLNTNGDITTFDAVNLRVLGFSPFSFNKYTAGEEVAVVGTKLGILSTGFAFGIFNAGLL